MYHRSTKSKRSLSLLSSFQCVCMSVTLWYIWWSLLLGADKKYSNNGTLLRPPSSSHYFFSSSLFCMVLTLHTNNMTTTTCFLFTSRSLYLLLTDRFVWHSSSSFVTIPFFLWCSKNLVTDHERWWRWMSWTSSFALWKRGRENKKEKKRTRLKKGANLVSTDRGSSPGQMNLPPHFVPSFILPFSFFII